MSAIQARGSSSVAADGAPHDIVDEINAIVDEQLQQEPSGYDHNINQDQCPHCGDEWHGLQVTERVRNMRVSYCGCSDCATGLSAYSADRDDSPVWCPGSMFIGPWATREQLGLIRAGLAGGGIGNPYSLNRLAQLRRMMVGPSAREFADAMSRPIDVELLTGILPPDPTPHRLFRDQVDEILRPLYVTPPRRRPDPADVPSAADALNRMLSMFGDLVPSLVDSFERMGSSMQRANEQIARAIEGFSADMAISDELQFTFRPWFPGDPELDMRTPQERALPRPSTTPPMWANNPTRTRRRRNR